MGLLKKGRGPGGSIALAEGIEGAVAKKKEAPAKTFKAVLWASADKLRAQMNAPEYKHLVLGLIFLNNPSSR